MRSLLILKGKFFLLFFLTVSNVVSTAEAIGEKGDPFSDSVMEHDVFEVEDVEGLSEHPRISPTLLDAIKSRPLFAESRTSAVQEDAPEVSTLLIDGNYEAVELIGTIESTDRHIAAFVLGNEETVWLRVNDYLGEWRIDDISSSWVRFISKAQIRVLRMRDNVSDERQQTEGSGLPST